MKKLLIIVGGLFLLQVGFAQSITKPVETKSSLIVSAGPAFPVGAFSSSSTADAGMAKTGYNINLNYVYNFSSIGIVVHGMYVDHATKIPDDYSAMDITMGHWKYSGITAGVVNSFPAGEKGKFDLRVLAGAGFAKSPVFTFPGESGTASIPSVNATAFLGEIGAGYRHMVGSNVFIYGGVDFLYMKPKFKDISVTPEAMEQKISALNVNAGVGFNF